MSGKNQYVQKAGQVLRVAGTRVSLDSIVYAFREGQSAESIVESYPVLTLEQVYGALAFYLRHQAQIDEYLRREESADEKLRRTWAAYPSELRCARDASEIPG